MAHKKKSHIPWWIVRSGGMWVVADIPRAAVLAYAIRYAPVPVGQIIWATGAEMGPAAARTAVRVGTIAYGSSAIVRGSVTVGRVAAAGAFAAVVGYAAGAIVGTAVSGLLFGEEGAGDAIALYSGQVSWQQYKSTVGGALSQTFG